MTFTTIPGTATDVAYPPVASLTLQFLAWVAHRPRSYAETMDAWRTSCPRFTIWEDALGDGLVQVESGRSGQVTHEWRSQPADARCSIRRDRPLVVPQRDDAFDKRIPGIDRNDVEISLTCFGFEPRRIQPVHRRDSCQLV